MLEEGRGPRVPRSRGPKDQDISKSHSNMSLLHFVGHFELLLFYNILVCWLFLGQDWRGPYAPFGVVDDKRG